MNETHFLRYAYLKFLKAIFMTRVSYEIIVILTCKTLFGLKELFWFNNLSRWPLTLKSKKIRYGKSNKASQK